MTLFQKFAAILVSFILGIFVTYGLQVFLVEETNNEIVPLSKGVSDKQRISNVSDQVTIKPAKLDGTTEDKPEVSVPKEVFPEQELSKTVSDSSEAALPKNRVKPKAIKIANVEPNLAIKKTGNEKNNKININKKKPDVKKKITLQKQPKVNSKKVMPIKKVVVEDKQAEKTNTVPIRVLKEDIKIEEGFAVENLLKKYWSSRDKPVVFLPTALNRCSKKDKKLICNSQILEEERANKIISYKVKSIITKNKNAVDEFNVVYRNLVLDVKDVVKDNIEEGLPVKTGWSKKHTAECRYTGNTTISCIKNGVHSMDIVGKDV